MSLRDHDDDAIKSFLHALEVKGARAIGGFSGYGGTSYAGALGANASFPYLQNRPPGAKYDYQLEAGDLWRNTVAAIAFAWIKKNFPEPRSYVGRRKPGLGWTEVETPDAQQTLETIEAPNTYYDGDTLWAATAVSWYVDGNAYWRKGQTLDGRTKEFWYTPHWQMYPRWDSEGKNFITHYEYIVDGKRETLFPDQIVHFRNGLDIRNYRYGNTELGCAVREVCSDNEAASYEATILRNLGIPGWIIYPEGEDDQIDSDQRKEIKDTWREEITGENRGGLLVSSVKMGMQRATLTPEEMSLDKIRRIPEARILGAIGVNAMTVGLTSSEGTKTYANYKEARQASYEDCLCPLQKTLGKQLTRQCPELFKRGQLLRWDYTEVEAMVEDRNHRAKRSVILYQGGLAKKQEARSMNGLPEDPADPDRDKYHQGEMMRGTLPTPDNNTVKDGDES